MYESPHATRPAETKRESLLFFQTVYPSSKNTQRLRMGSTIFAQKKSRLFGPHADRCLGKYRERSPVFGKIWSIFTIGYILIQLANLHQAHVWALTLGPRWLSEDHFFQILPQPNLSAFWAERDIPWITYNLRKSTYTGIVKVRTGSPISSCASFCRDRCMRWYALVRPSTVIIRDAHNHGGVICSIFTRV